MLLALPIDGYMEPSGGPIPIRNVQWVQLSTMRVKGGLAGRPLERVDIAPEIVSGLRGLDVAWELRQATWSVARIFDERPLQVVHLVNPFGPNAGHESGTYPAARARPLSR
jgi:hypothetical protein